MLITDAIAVSLEFRFLIDRGLAAQQGGRRDMQSTFIRAAQGLLEAALPEIATEVARTASRKGDGGRIASLLVPHLTPATAAAVCVVWMLRGARAPAINALKDAFGSDLVFNTTIRTLCQRIFEPVPERASTQTTGLPATSLHAIEASAPYRS